MNISKNEVDALNLTVNIEITPEDYQDKVNSVLQNYRKSANIPGFRPGKVPMGLIKKQYGKAVLIDEINKMLQDSIYNYIQEEKLNILGNPLPVEQEENPLFWKYISKHQISEGMHQDSEPLRGKIFYYLPSCSFG